MHDIPPKLRPVMGVSRLATSLETEDERAAKRRAQLLWVHDWSKRIERAQQARSQTIEEEAAFYRRLLLQAESEEEREALLERIADIAEDRYTNAMIRAGYVDPREASEDIVVPEAEEADRFFKLATGQLVRTSDHLDEWLASLRNEPKTKDMKRATVAKFCEAFPYLQDIKRKEVQRWINRKAIEEGLATKTIKRMLSELRGYWSFLQSLELVPEDSQPFDKLITNGKKSEDWKPFEPIDVVRLQCAAEAEGDQPLADLIRLAMWTGARIESLCRLKTTDVYPEFIRIEDDKTDAGNREVPIHTRLKPTLDRLVADSKDGYVLSELPTNKYGDRSNAIGKRFGRLKKQLGFGKMYVFHSIRKTVATMLENAGVPENVAADILGHEKPRITYGLYSGGSSLATKQDALSRIDYPESA